MTFLWQRSAHQRACTHSKPGTWANTLSSLIKVRLGVPTLLQPEAQLAVDTRSRVVKDLNWQNLEKVLHQRSSLLRKATTLQAKTDLSGEGDATLQQQTQQRLAGLLGLESPLLICNEDHRFIVAVNFEAPEYTANSDALGTPRILEAVRLLGLTQKTRIYQAFTSELYSLVQEIPQKESTPFYPRSPYGVAKLYAHWITVNYREAYGIYACNGLLFDHESPRRGETFVTRKITRGLARIDAGLEDCLYMANLDVLRDWGHARDYVEMQWRMLQQVTPEDFVIATGRQESVRRFIELAAAERGWGAIEWEGEGVNEIGRRNTGEVVVRIDLRYFRPAEVETLLGDPTKAPRNWAGRPPPLWISSSLKWWRTTAKKRARKHCCGSRAFRWWGAANDADRNIGHYLV